jgi:hypothetical protein
MVLMTMNASERITKYITEPSDWRAKVLTQARAVVRTVAPNPVEEWKWKTAALPDPRGLFNAGLEAKASRAIDIYESDRVDVKALTNLVRATVAHNHVEPTTKRSTKRKAR